MHDLHEAATVLAGLGFDVGIAAIRILIGNTGGGIAQHAFDTHDVPLRRAQRATAEPRTDCTCPADDRRGHRSTTTYRTGALADRYQRLCVKLRGDTGKVHLQRRGDVAMIGHRLDRDGVGKHRTHHFVARGGVGRARPL